MNDRRPGQKKLSKTIQFVSAVLVYAILIALVAIQVSETNFDISRIFNYGALLGEGIVNTLIISGYALLFGLILGFILYAARESSVYFIRSLANIFIEVMMGTPLLVLVIITTYFIGAAFNSHDDYFLGVIAITSYIGPYMANMFKSAIGGIDRQQFVVMDLYGFTKFQRYRYIILPQIMRLLMPSLMNNLSYTVKGSALLYVTAVTEISYAIKLIQSKTFAYTEGYVVLWIAYLVITLSLSMVTKYIERRYKI